MSTRWLNLRHKFKEEKMTKRGEHPNKEIEAAIKYAEKSEWEFRKSGNSSHAWGRLYCPLHTREGHHMSIYTTPKNPTNYAKLIRQRVDKCEHSRRIEYEKI
jgi:hypothetical protein